MYAGKVVDMGDFPTRITSLQNERVKDIRALEMRKSRRETGLFVAEGVSVIIAARDHGHVPQTLVVRTAGDDAPSRVADEVVAWARSEGCDVLEVSTPVMEKLAAKDNPQTLLAVYAQRWSDVPDAAALKSEQTGPERTWLALEAIRDPGNLGTILRTAEAVGVSGIILAGACCDPHSREAVRASMGSIFALPLVRMDEAALHDLMARWPGDTVGTHLSAKADFRSVRYRGPTLLVMGGEGPGLTEATTRACKQLVKIPMAGRLDSLNLAVATALTLYQIRGDRLRLSP
jgi:RNA methyltransferase, TrmH family